MSATALKDWLVRLENPATFRALAPDLPITELPLRAYAPQLPRAPLAEEARADMVERGYWTREALLSETDVARMNSAVRGLTAAGLPALFAYVYDPFWTALAALGPVVSPLLGSDHDVLADFWAWHVAAGQSGWSPHRGFCENVRTPEGLPRLVNVWLALTDVTPDTACMYVVPWSKDTNATLDGIAFDPHDAVALPLKRGGAAIWNANVLHWGGACRSADRISFSFTLATRGAFSDAVLPWSEPLSYSRRIELIAQQLNAYASKAKDLDVTLRQWAAVTTQLRTR